MDGPKYLLKHFVHPEGTVDLYHYSAHSADTLTTDPSKFGKNSWSHSERKADGNPKTFFYTDLADTEGFFHGKPLYHAKYDTQKLYDATEDPKGHVAGSNTINDLIARLKNLNYHGMFYSGVFPTVAIWHPVEMQRVEKKKMARMKAPAGGAVVNNTYSPGGQFLAKSMRRIRDVVAKLSRRTADMEHLLSEVQATRAGGRNPTASAAMLALADHMMEAGIPGAEIMRDAGYHAQAGNPSERKTDSEMTRGWFSDPRHEGDDPRAETMDVFPNPTGGHNIFYPTEYIGDVRLLTHLNRPYKIFNCSPHVGGPMPLHLYFPLYSREHLRRLTSDLPEHDRKAIHIAMDPHLPETHPDTPMKMARKKPRSPAGTKKLWAWLEQNPILKGIYGIPEVEKAVSSGRRLTPEEVANIEEAFKMPEGIRLPKDKRSNVSQRLRWLNHIHDSLNDKAGFGTILRSKSLPEHARAAVQQAVKLGYLLHFHPLLRAGFPDAPDPLEWYGTSMNPLDVAFHTSFAKKGKDGDPQWGNLNDAKDALHTDGKDVWDHAPASTVMRAIVGITSPGMNPEKNGVMAHKIITVAHQRAKAAGSDQWVDYLPDNQSEYLRSWMSDHGVTHPNTTDPAKLMKWVADLSAKHPTVQNQGVRGYKSADFASVNGVPLGVNKDGYVKFFSPAHKEAHDKAKAARKTIDKVVLPIVSPEGKLLPKEWSPNASIAAGLRTVRRLLHHVRTTEKPEGTVAELKAMSKWLLTHHPLSELDAVRKNAAVPGPETETKGDLKLGFRKEEAKTLGLRGAQMFGPKVGEFVPALSGRDKYPHQHVQDMHETWSSVLAHGGLVFNRGNYDEKKSEGLNDPTRRVLWASANAALEYMKKHHPDHPIFKHGPNDTSAVQAAQWVGAKMLRDEGGLLDFLHTDPSPFVENKDYVDAANKILAPHTGKEKTFSPTGKRKLSRPDETSLSALIRSAAANRSDANARWVLADFLRDHGLPGADVASAHADAAQKHDQKGAPRPPAANDRPIKSHPIVTLGGKAATFKDPTSVQEAFDADPENVSAVAQIVGREGVRGPVSLLVNHRIPGAVVEDHAASLTHGVILHSVDDFLRHTTDFPKNARKMLLSHALKSLPKPETPVKLSRGSADHVVYVSPSLRERSTLHDAAMGVHSPEMQALVAAAARMPSVRGGESGIGFWSDGAEESRKVALADPKEALRVAAALGRQFKQKSVLAFVEGEGDDTRHVIVVPDTDVEKIHADMMRHGIEYKTLLPHPSGTQIEAIDSDSLHTPAFLGYADEAGALSHERRVGTATFLGDENRDEAVKKYEAVLR